MTYGWQTGGNSRNQRRARAREGGGNGGGKGGGKSGGNAGDKWKAPRGSYVACGKAACKNWGQWGDKADWSCPQCGTAYDWQSFWQSIKSPAAPRQQQQQQRQQQHQQPDSSTWGYRSDGYWEALGEEDDDAVADRTAANITADQEDEQMAEAATKEAEEGNTHKGPTWRAEKATRSAKAKTDNEAKEKCEEEAEEARSEWYDAGTRVSNMRKEQAKVRTRLDKLLGEIDDQLAKVATADSNLIEAVDDATCLEKVWRDKEVLSQEAMRSRVVAQGKKLEASKTAAKAAGEARSKAEAPVTFMPRSPPTTPKAAPKGGSAAASTSRFDHTVAGSSCPAVVKTPDSSAIGSVGLQPAGTWFPASNPGATASTPAAPASATIVADGQLALPGVSARLTTAEMEGSGAVSSDDEAAGDDTKATDVSCDDVDLWRSVLVHWIWYAKPDDTLNKEVLAWTDIWGGEEGEKVKQEFEDGAIYARDQLAARREEFRLEWRKAQDLAGAGDSDAAQQLAWQIEAYGDRLKAEYGTWLSETITAKIGHLLAKRETELLNGTNAKRPKSFQYDLAPKRKGNKGKGKGNGGKHATAGGKGPRADVLAAKGVIQKPMDKEKGFLYLDKAEEDEA